MSKSDGFEMKSETRQVAMDVQFHVSAPTFILTWNIIFKGFSRPRYIVVASPSLGPHNKSWRQFVNSYQWETYKDDLKTKFKWDIIAKRSILFVEALLILH